MHSEQRVLIVEASYDRGALAACRALATEGWTVGVASSGGAMLAASSRCASHRHTVPPPHEGVSAFAEAVAGTVAEGGYEVVLPGAGDAEAIALSLSRELIGASLPYAPHEVVVRAHDKLELCRVAEQVGVRTPETADASEAQLGRWKGKLLLKPRLHAPFAGDAGPSRFEAEIVASGEEARTKAETIAREGGEPIVQELVPGQLMAFVAVTDRHGAPLARAQQVSTLTWPPRAGVSVRARTVPIDDRLAERVQKLLVELGWWGIAELQFVLPEAGEPLLIDFNGRFYGSLALAVAAGANLPAIWAAQAVGGVQAEARDAKPGVHYQWLEGDLRRALRDRRGGLVRDVASCLAFAPRTSAHSIWSRRDPAPLAGAILSLAARGGARLLDRLRGRARRALRR